MKKCLICICLLLLSSASWAVLPPRYLSVPEWQSCVGTVKKGSADFVCLPAEKPETCPDTSWENPDLKTIEACPE